MQIKNKSNMSVIAILGLLIIGLAAGYFSGLIGIGGAIIIVPALVYIYGFNQHLAQGTTLGIMIPPIGILAAINYYQKGFMDIKTAAIICVGFIVGGYLGSLMAIKISQDTLRRIFAVLLVIMGIRMFFNSH